MEVTAIATTEAVPMLSREALRPGMAPMALFVTACCLLPLALYLSGLFIAVAVLCLIVIHHAGHEAVHFSLSPSGTRRANEVAGWVAYAMLGQNFILMRWSHLTHHRWGRLRREFTIDESDASQNPAYYYACLLGASNIYHEVAGYLYPITEPKLNVLTRRFQPRFYRNWRYITGQLFVATVNVALWAVGGWALLIVKLIFTLYWGACQNVAHFRLEVGEYEHARVAARTYRLPLWLEFLVYRGGIRHLEHHMFPFVPGVNLHMEVVSHAARTRLGRPIESSGGIKAYLADLIAQFKVKPRPS